MMMEILYNGEGNGDLQVLGLCKYFSWTKFDARLLYFAPSAGCEIFAKRLEEDIILLDFLGNSSRWQ